MSPPPFISAPGPWYSAYGQPGWSCPWGIAVNFGNGAPPYRTFLTNASNSSPLDYTIGPATAVAEWGLYSNERPIDYYFIDELSVVFGNVYYFVVQDSKKQWAWSEGITLQPATLSTRESLGCTPPSSYSSDVDNKIVRRDTGEKVLEGFWITGLSMIAIGGLGLFLAFIFEEIGKEKARCLRENAELEARAQELAEAPGAAVVIEMEPIGPGVDTEFEEGANMAKLQPMGEDESEEVEVEIHALRGPDGEILDGDLPEYALQE